MLMMPKLKEMLHRHEGYRKGVYPDTVGVPTGGYGHAFLVGSELPKWIWDAIFEWDLMIAFDSYRRLDKDLDLALDPVRQAVVIDMLFNLGITKLRKFKLFLGCLQKGDWHGAATEMLDSKWATQVGKRAQELAAMMEKGEWV